ncbi:Epn2 [Linum perenne]
MGTIFLNQMKKQARSFLQEKYKTARLALTDVAPIELLTEEATNNDPWGPDAKTMTKIAVASFGVDAYWRIVFIIHKRLDTVDWKQWRQSYKTLVLLEFLMTHGPEELADEFNNDIDIIEQLGTFQFIDDKGFNWGMNMQKRADNILGLLRGGEAALKEARVKALKISNEIQGFGSSTPSSAAAAAASSSPTFSTTTNSTPSSAVSDCSFATAGSTFEDICRLENLSLTEELDDQYYSNDAAADDRDQLPGEECIAYNNNNNNYDNQVRMRWTKSVESGTYHRWDGHDPVQEKGSLLDDKAKDRKSAPSDNQGLVGGFCAKIMTTTSSTATSPKKDYGDNENYNKNDNNDNNNGNTTGFRSISDVGKFLRKRYDRQFSIGY